MKTNISLNKKSINVDYKNTLLNFIQISSVFVVSKAVLIYTLLFFATGPFSLVNNNEKLALGNLLFNIKKVLIMWDSGWYKSIIDIGYTYVPNGHLTPKEISVAFYYVYPMIAQFIKNIFHFSTESAMIITSNLAMYLSLFLIYYISRIVKISKNAAFIGIILYSVNPFSIFLTAGYSESTYVLISAITIIFILKKKYIPAAIIGGLLSGVRSVGIFFTLIFLIYYFIIEKNRLTVSNIIKMGLLSLISIWGKVAFLIFNYVKFNEIFASEIVQKYWGNVGGNLTLIQKIKNLIKYMLTPFKERFNPLNPSSVSILVVYFLLIISLLSVISIIFRIIKKGDKFNSVLYDILIDKKQEALLLTWSLVQIILPLIIFGMKGNNVFSMGRYVLPMFPLYILLGNILEKRKKVYSLLLVIFVFEMLLIALGFSYGYPRGVLVY